MRAKTKQLLGFGGLALVVGLTTVAYNLPADAISVGADVDVYVEVYSNAFETKIEHPLDGDIYTEANVSFQEIHSKAKNVKYYLTYTDADGKKTEYELKDYEVNATGDPVDGVTQFILNLDEYGGYGRYKFSSVITSIDGRTLRDDVEFVYTAINAEQEDVTTSKKDDSVSWRVYYSSGVKSITYQILDKDGKEVSKVYTLVTDHPDTGSYLDLTQILTDLKLSAGRYTIMMYGYDNAEASGTALDSTSVYFDYTESPNVPDTDDVNVPDTGSVLAALNISKADYLITGLIGFSLISIIALFVIRRSHRRE